MKTRGQAPRTGRSHTPRCIRIEGYASLTSVNTGDPIDLLVSTRAARYSIDVFRMGWYGGAGARHLTGPIVRNGLVQSVPPPDPETGLVDCNWRDPYRLDTRDESGTWPSGISLARLTTMTGAGTHGADVAAGLQSFIVFVVRDDERPSALLFQSSVTTFAAYNNWGGTSLYGFNSGDTPARKVSFNRPYAANPYGVRLDGAGDFLRRWEYNAVRFLEREGYDVTYDTDVDTHLRPLADTASPLHHRVFLSVGHDEYWSMPMRRHVEQARDRGVHLAFLGADVCYWQVRFEPDVRGNPDRILVSYKEAAGDLDPLALDGTPQNNRLITGRWRDRPISRPEARLVGVMYTADPVDADIIVDRPDHWAFAGTGVKKGDALRGLLGYEVDAMSALGPPAIERLAHSPFTDQGTPKNSPLCGHDHVHSGERRTGVRDRIDAVELGPGRLQRPNVALAACERGGTAHHAQRPRSHAADRGARSSTRDRMAPEPYRADRVGHRDCVRSPGLDLE